MCFKNIERLTVVFGQGISQYQFNLTVLFWSELLVSSVLMFLQESGLCAREDCFYRCSERNNVLVLFGTLKVQSFILTEVSDFDLLIVVTSSTFLKRKDMLKEKNSWSKISSRLSACIYTCVLCTHIRIRVC
jgi:hypothetical protein